MTELLTVSGAAREIGRRRRCVVRPRDVSTLLYDRAIDDALCPIIAGHRMIAPDILPLIEQALIDRGILSPQVDGGAAT